MDLPRFAYKFNAEFLNLIYILIKVPNPDKEYVMYFDGEIPDYRLIGTLNPDKTPETDLSRFVRINEVRLYKVVLKPLTRQRKVIVNFY